MLNSKVIIVTGASRGIGQAIALACANEGATVVCAARDQATLEPTVERIRASRGQALAAAVDVSVEEQVRQLFEGVLAEFGRVDALFNNAGRQTPIGKLVDCDPQAWLQTIMVNLMGTVHCCQAVLPGMIERRRGKIVNLSGGGAASPRPNFSAYAASKAAIVRLTETLAEEVQAFNVQVNAIAPGAVNTAMLDEVLAAGDKAGAAALEQARRQKDSGGTSLEAVTSLAVFLASDDSKGLTGKLISAPHDPWQSWGEECEALSASLLYTLRRLDPFTLKPLLGELA
jgi:NAD(P)-dependent dehydrogenase (short-subunit alcohol dehydrogenase family)